MFHPIEIDPSIPMEEKIQHIASWWRQVQPPPPARTRPTTRGLFMGVFLWLRLLQSSDLFVKYRITRSMVQQMAQTPLLQLRPGMRKLFLLAGKHGIPVHIFSAGLYDIIRLFLAREGLAELNNIHVIANMMAFDEQGAFTGYTGKTVAALTKTSRLLEDSPLWAEAMARRNALVVGDSATDVTMVEGIPLNACLKVGLLNANGPARSEEFEAAFDVIVEGDTDAEDVFSLVEYIVQ